MRVKPSPFNHLKLELAVIVILGAVLLLIQHRISSDGLVQMVLLAGYGVLAMIWLMLRTRLVIQRQQQRLDDAAGPGPAVVPSQRMSDHGHEQ